MRAKYGKILVVAFASVVLLGAARDGWAAEKKEKSIWSEENPRLHRQRFELTAERVEQIMDRLSQGDPEKVEELERLRQDDPERFRAELRELMRQQFGRRGRGERGGRGEGFAGRRFKGGPGRPGGPGARERWRGMMHRQREEFAQWLKENYPDELGKLEQLRADHPEMRGRRQDLVFRKYRKIFEASKENPELAEVLKQDLELKQQRSKLLREIRRAKEDNVKKELVQQLKQVVSERFDLLVRKKEIEYEYLRSRLEELRKKVEQSEAEVAKWKDADFKTENVKGRVEELVAGMEKFKWD